MASFIAAAIEELQVWVVRIVATQLIKCRGQSGFGWLLIVILVVGWMVVVVAKDGGSNI